MEEANLRELMVLTVRRLADIKATQEIILKTQATFVAKVSGQDWQPLFEDLRKQAQEASAVYQEQLLNELALLQRKPGNPRKN